MNKPLTQLSITLFIMVGIALWVISKAQPASEMTRLRNALLLDVGTIADFTWSPQQAPKDFNSEKGNVPKEIQVFAQAILGNSEWKKTLNAVDALRGNAHLNGAIQANTVTALNEILISGRGYCADFTQVMNAVSYQQKISIREWGMSFDGYGGWGHAFNEVYIDEWKKWVFIDVFNGFYVTTNESNIPLSTLEFREILATTPDKVLIHRTAGRFGFKSDQVAIEYYLRGVNQFYLWWGNDSLTYDDNAVINFIAPLGRAIEQASAILIGIHPKIRILPLPENIEMREAMIRLKHQLMIAFMSEVLLGFLLLYFLVMSLRKKPIERKF